MCLQAEKYPERANAIHSDTGTESHKPFIPNKNGKTRIAAVKNTKVLEKAIIAEILPFDNAVNSILENVLKPTSKSANENSLFPLIGDWDKIPSLYHEILDYAAAKKLELIGNCYEMGLNEFVISSEDEYVTRIEIQCNDRN